MKKYITPSLQFAELRTEERLAGEEVCNGQCSSDVEYDGVKYYVLSYS